MKNDNVQMTRESKMALCELGYYYINNKEFEKALAIFKTLIIIDDQLPFRFGLANLLFARAEYRDSIEICESILKDHEDDIPSNILIAENYIFLNEIDKARDILHKVLSMPVSGADKELANNLLLGIDQGISQWTAKGE